MVPHVDVEVSCFPVARKRGVPPLAIKLIGSENEGPVHRRALRAMRGERVAVVEVTFLEIARRHVDLAFRTERDGEGTTVGVDVDDRSALAIRHAEPTVIATRQDDLAGGKASAANFQLGCAKSTPGTHPITR